MKVLLVNDYATPTAGAEIMVVRLRNALRERGHDARVLASEASLIPGPSFADWTCEGTTTRLQAVRSTWNASARRVLVDALGTFEPDVVHVHMFLWQLSPAILDPLRDVPAVYHVHTYKPICPTGSKRLPDGRDCDYPPGPACLRSRCLTPQSWVAAMARRRLWERGRDAFDRFVVPSRVMRERLEANGVGPCDVIPFGHPTRPERPPLAGDPVLAYAGRLSTEKGVDVLLRAFATVVDRVPAARLWIAGDGPERRSLERLAERLDVARRTEFLGQLDRDELASRFDQAWIQVIPSVWEEPFGVVAIEAMMRGTAVVASEAGGLRDTVRHGQTGLHVPPGDPDRLATALVALASDRARCETLGAAGRRVAVREYGMDRYRDRILDVYAELLARYPVRPVETGVAS